MWQRPKEWDYPWPVWAEGPPHRIVGYKAAYGIHRAFGPSISAYQGKKARPIVGTYQFREEEPRYARRVEMDEIEKNDFNLNISRDISTAVSEAEVDLQDVHTQMVTLAHTVQYARDTHNRFLQALGLPLLP